MEEDHSEVPWNFNPGKFCWTWKYYSRTRLYSAL